MMKSVLYKLNVFIIVSCSILTLVGIKTNGVQAYTPPNLKIYEQVDTEFRAVWVATVYNLDIPKLKSTSTEDIEIWKNAYLTILDDAQAAHMNAIIFQIRPCNDAFYPSKYNPWSEYLYSYGENPGFDPLQWMIEVTHARGMEYHAWMNPYRASVSSEIKIVEQSGTIRHVIDYDDSELQEYKKRYFASLKEKGEIAFDGTLIDNPVFATEEELEHNVVLGTEEKFVLNPALDETIEHLENTIREVIENYEIDGIHFDDYFYPYTATYSSIGTNANFKGKSFSTEPIIDYADYQDYVSRGGVLSIYNWRRDNINRLIENLSIMIRELNTTKERPCAFGISPAGRWAPSIESCPAGSERGAEGGMSGSCYNYYSYSDLYADTKKWVDEEWVDYILPQVYSQLGGSYEEVVKWWSKEMADSPVKLYIGSPLYQQDEWGSNLEVYNQIRYNQSEGHRVDGYSMYDYTSMTKGKGKSGINSIVKYLWKCQALTPIYKGYTYQNSVSDIAKEKIIQKVDDDTLRIEYHMISDAKAYGLYKFTMEDITDSSNYTADKLVSMNLQGCDYFTLSSYDENATYVIVTYAMDNSLHIGKKVDFTTIIENQPPIIEVLELPKEVLVEQPIQAKFRITDRDSEDSVSFQIYLIRGISEVLCVEQTGIEEDIVVNVKGFFVETEGLKFKIIATDGKAETMLITDYFDVVESCTTHSPISEATCTEDSVCSMCGNVIQPALGHEISEWKIETEASCTSEGKRYKECTRCGEKIEEETIAKKEHEWKEADCTTPKTCTICGQTEGEALGHEISEWKIETEASCTSEGKRYKECTRCGEKIEEETIAKKEHEWEEATTERPKTCRNCGETEGEKLVIPEVPISKKGCRKSSISIIWNMIVLSTITIIIVRKRSRI